MYLIAGSGRPRNRTLIDAFCGSCGSRVDSWNTQPRSLARAVPVDRYCAGWQLGRWWLSLSGRGGQPDGSLVAGLVAERKSADHHGALVRFVLSGRLRRMADLSGGRRGLGGVAGVVVCRLRGSRYRWVVHGGRHA